MLIAALAVAALAHGPAPAVLDVLDVGPALGCPETADALGPRLLRSNTGVHVQRADGSYAFGCPARWGEAEVALASADGPRVLFASTAGAFLSTDDGCTAADLGLPEGETPVVTRAGAGALWLTTRNFRDGSATLWRIDDGLSEVQRWTDFFPDGLAIDDDGALWLAGAVPAMSVRVWKDGVFADRTPSWPDLGATPDRLTPRVALDGGVWLAVGVGSERRLWWTDGEAVELGPGPAEGLLGPVPVGGALIATLDGRVWRRDGGWTDTGVDVPWTCLTSAGGAAWACYQREVRWLRGWSAAGPEEQLVASLDQLAGPDPTCDAVDGACDADWLHFGGESGWNTSGPAACPGDPRPPIDEAGPGPDDEPTTCGCASADRPSAALLAAALAAIVGRRRTRAR